MRARRLRLRAAAKRGNKNDGGLGNFDDKLQGQCSCGNCVAWCRPSVITDCAAGTCLTRHSNTAQALPGMPPERGHLCPPAGFLIDPEEIEVCTRDDGTEWLLVGAPACRLLQSAQHQLYLGCSRSALAHPPGALLVMLAEQPHMVDMQEKRPYGETLRGVRGGVQDVAVKRLLCSTDGKLEKFVEVQNLQPCKLARQHSGGQ
jgi:hypothetical protein